MLHIRSIGDIWFCADRFCCIWTSKEAQPRRARISRRNQALSPRGVSKHELTGDESSRAVGKTVAQAEGLVPGARMFVPRILRDGAILDAKPDMTIRAGDVLAVAGRREVLVEILGQGPAASEIENRELLNIPTTSVDAFVTNKRVIGRTIQDIVNKEAVRGVLSSGISAAIRTYPRANYGDRARGHCGSRDSIRP
jgi:uncharacterized transporter YbjL